MKDLLTIIPGRVVAQTPHTATVEYPGEQMPTPGSWLAGAGDTILEVVSHTCPTETRTIVRRGKAPTKGTQVTPASPPTLPPLDTLWGQSISGYHTVENGIPLLAHNHTSASNTTELSSAQLLSTGHPGLDILSPLAKGHGLAMVSEDHQTPHNVAQAAISHIMAQNPAMKLLVVSPNSSPAWKNAEQDIHSRTIHLTPTQGATHGERALIMRTAQAVCQAMVHAGHEVLIVLDQPDALLTSRRAIEPNLVAASAMVVDYFHRWLDDLLSTQSPSVTVLALWAQNPTKLPVPGAGVGGYLPTTRFASWIHMEGDTLSPAYAQTSVKLPGALAQLRTQCLSAMAARETMSDHAAIFGMDELDPEQEDALERAQRCHDFLAHSPGTAMALEDTTSQLQNLLEEGFSAGR